MEIKYFVIRAFRYASSKNWEYQLVGMYDNESAAKQAWHDNMGRIIKDSNDICMCTVITSTGKELVSDYRSLVEPEPEPNEE